MSHTPLLGVGGVWVFALLQGRLQLGLVALECSLGKFAEIFLLHVGVGVAGRLRPGPACGGLSLALKRDGMDFGKDKAGNEQPKKASMTAHCTCDKPFWSLKRGASWWRARRVCSGDNLGVGGLEVWVGGC